MSTTPTTENARIVELRVENVKRIKAVRITPEGSMIEITGKNGQGKTSILDAISYALGGKSLHPTQPIRDGAESAQVIVDLGDMIVERTWTADGKTVLNLKNKEGAKFGSPQQILDRFVGELTFDPLAFSRMPEKEQAATLKAVAGLDFDEIDSLRAGAFDERTVVNREHKAAVAQLQAMPPVPDDTPDEELKFNDLSIELNNALGHNQNNEQIRNEGKRLQVEAHTVEEKIQKLKDELIMQEQRLQALQQQIENNTRDVENLREIDVDSIQKRMASAEAINRNVRAKQARLALEKRVAELKEASDNLTAAITKFDDKKQEMLAQAKLPVPGLSFGDDGITLNGLPFNQASSSEQLRVSVAMGLALNPRLKVMLVRDGSLLDSEGRAMLAAMADEAGAQVWMERATDGEPIGVVIEDGEVKMEEVHVDA